VDRPLDVFVVESSLTSVSVGSAVANDRVRAMSYHQ
jgi:hypothetical protein